MAQVSLLLLIFLRDREDSYTRASSLFSLGSYSTMYPATALAATVKGVSRGVAMAQTGLVRSYAFTLVAGAAVLAVYFLTKANL